MLYFKRFSIAVVHTAPGTIGESIKKAYDAWMDMYELTYQSVTHWAYTECNEVALVVMPNIDRPTDRYILVGRPENDPEEFYIKYTDEELEAGVPTNLSFF